MVTIEMSDGETFEVCGEVERVAARWGRQPMRRGRSLPDRLLMSRPRVVVHLEERPGPELLARAGDYPELVLDGEVRRRVRIGVQHVPAMLVVEWVPEPGE